MERKSLRHINTRKHKTNGKLHFKNATSSCNTHTQNTHTQSYLRSNKTMQKFSRKFHIEIMDGMAW